MNTDLSLLPEFPEDVPTCPLIVIDYSKLEANDRAEKDALWEACTTIGFFYLKNYGFEAENENMWNVVKETLELPVEEKEKYDAEDVDFAVKYKGAGVGIVDRNGTRDTAEFYNIFKDEVIKPGGMRGDEFPKPLMDGIHHAQKFVENSERISRHIVGIFDEYLQLPPGTLLAKHIWGLPSFSQCRAIRNPGGVDPTKVSVVPHTDFGTLSTVYHKKLGGLQVFDIKENDWKYVKPLDGHTVCNVGDALAAYSGGILRSSMHRVVPAPGAQNEYTRWSLCYFLRPSGSTIMEPLTESPMVAKAVAETPLDIPPNCTASEWYKRRILNLIASRHTGAASWAASRGTEPDKNQ